MWKAFEGSRIQQLVKGLDTPIIDDGKRQKISLVANYLNVYSRQHNCYFYFYFLTEILNLINVIFQMKIMDYFLGGEFTTYGWNVINFTEWDWTVRFDPMVNLTLFCQSMFIQLFAFR